MSGILLFLKSTININVVNKTILNITDDVGIILIRLNTYQENKIRQPCVSYLLFVLVLLSRTQGGYKYNIVRKYFMKFKSSVIILANHFPAENTN